MIFTPNKSKVFIAMSKKVYRLAVRSHTYEGKPSLDSRNPRNTLHKRLSGFYISA